MKFKGRENEYHREWQRAWRKKNKEKRKEDRRKQQYGLTKEQWADLSRAGCGICGTLERLVVDHDHATGRVRGALCSNHNVGIGLFGDDPDTLRRAIQWLERQS